VKSLLIGFTLLAAAVAASAQTTPTCSASTLTGTRSFVLTGRTVSAAGVFSKSYYAVGTANFDGVSKVTVNVTSSSNSSQSVAQTLAGSYSLASTCVGALNITTGDTASFTLIAYNSGKNFTLTGQDATYSFTGSGATQPASCATSTLSGTYAFSGNGFSLATGAILGVYTISGVLTFDGAGSVTGSWYTAINGVQTPDSISGTYIMSPSCVATATISDNKGNADTLAFTVTSADGANFSSSGSSSSNLFLVTGHSTFTNPGLAVGNSAGVTGGAPPGSLFSVYGFNLSTGQAQPTTFPLPLTAASAMVLINNVAVPLVYVDKGQINAQMPVDLQPGVATLVVKNGTTVSNSVAITVPATPIPGVYVYGSNHAIAQNFPSYTLNASSAPAAAGDVVIVYLNGGGAVQGESSIVTGRATPSGIFPVTASYSATIAGVPATVDFIGLTPGIAGLYQANIVIPKVAAGEHPLILTVGGVASNSTTVSTK
jgi:uncharacterized protein (TIGR03437 family)